MKNRLKESVEQHDLLAITWEAGFDISVGSKINVESSPMQSYYMRLVAGLRFV